MPCPECGYDLRATAVQAGWVACPECGERWVAAALHKTASHKSADNGQILAWLFGMPILYLLVLRGVAGIIGWMFELSLFTKNTSLLIGTVCVVAYLNKTVATRSAERIVRKRFRSAWQESGTFWLCLVLLTVVHLGLMVIYPVLGCCGCVLLQGFNRP